MQPVNIHVSGNIRDGCKGCSHPVLQADGQVVSAPCRKIIAKDVLRIKKAYIAGSYTAPTPEQVEENVKRAEAIAWLYYLKGYAVFCPHAQTHRIHLRYNNDEIFEYEDWLQADIAWLKDCDVIVFVAGWEESKGARMEHIIAKALGKEIHYITEEEVMAVMKDAKR